MSLFWAFVTAIVNFAKDPLGAKARKAEAERKKTLQQLRDSYSAHKESIRGHLEAFRFDEAEDMLAEMREVRKAHDQIAMADEKIGQHETIAIVRGIIEAREDHAKKQAEQARLERERREQAERKLTAARDARLNECLRLVGYHVETGLESLSIKDGSVSAETLVGMAQQHCDAAQAAYDEAKNISAKDATYKGVIKLKKAITAQRQLIAARKEAEERAEAERKAAKLREAEKARKDKEQSEAEAKRLERKSKKANEAKALAEAALTSGFAALTDGNIDKAETCLEQAADSAREANRHVDGTCPSKMAKPLREAIEAAKAEKRAKLESERMAREKAEAERSAREAAEAQKRAEMQAKVTWLTTFFASKKDPNRRCAVCFAQAERLVMQMGMQIEFNEACEDMGNFLYNGYRQFGVQLCDFVAGQALDETGKLYGHRIFGRSGLKIAEEHADSDTGEIKDLETLEAKIEQAARAKSFAKKFGSWKQHAERKAQAKAAEVKAGIKQAVDQVFTLRKERAAKAA